MKNLLKIFAKKKVLVDKAIPQEWIKAQTINKDLLMQVMGMDAYTDYELQVKY